MSEPYITNYTRALNRRLFEYVFWILISIVLSFPFWLELFAYGISEPQLVIKIVTNNYGLLILAFMSAVVPYLISQIFGASPFDLIRRRIADRKKNVKISTKSESVINIVQQKPRNYRQDPHDVILDQLSTLAKSSAKISEKMYNRAGVYLLVGVMIAFIGLFFFYFLQSSSVAKNDQWQDRLMSILPRFGILFFIEFIAFFFLRQYRVAMDEFRYFEGIKRRREENLILLRFFYASKKPLDLFKLLEKAQFYSDMRPLGKGETTELIESNRISADEARILEKMVETIGAKFAKKKKND